MGLTGADLLSLADYERYIEYALANGLGGPQIPAVGANYGAGGAPKVVYCGLASRDRDVEERGRAVTRKPSIFGNSRSMKSQAASPTVLSGGLA